MLHNRNAIAGSGIPAASGLASLLERLHPKNELRRVTMICCPVVSSHNSVCQC
jgi:hypothetical protein